MARRKLAVAGSRVSRQAILIVGGFLLGFAVAALISSAATARNAPRVGDADLPSEHGLADAYVKLGGNLDDPGGHTWGYQSGRTRFPPARLDKVLYAGALRPTKLERLGVGVLVDDPGARMRLENIGEEEYVTDHYGLWCVFDLGDHMGLARGDGCGMSVGV